MKEFLQTLKNNLLNNAEFYKFNQIYATNTNVIYYNGKPFGKLGVGFPVIVPGTCMPKLMYDLAYKKDGKLYQILTNKEIKVVTLGANIISDEYMLAAEKIELASSEDIEFFVSLMSKKKNLKLYNGRQKENAKILKKISKR